MTWHPSDDGETPAGWQATSSERDISEWVRDHTKALIIAAAVIVVVVGAVIAGASGDGSDGVRPAIKDMVDTLQSQGDCVSLQQAFDRDDDADNLSYIDDALRRAGCYDD